MPSVLRIKNPDGTWYEVTALKGDTGITPNLQVGTVTTGNPGTSAEVTITGTPEEPVLNFKIPKGEPGTGGDGGANIDDNTPSSTTTYSSQKIESELTALNDANAALIEVSKTEPNAENTELWIHPNADEVQLPQINDSVESVQDTWSSKKIAAEVSNKVHEKDLAVVAKSGSYNDLTNKPSALPNPNKLKLTGAVTAEYDGSATVEVTIPEGGSGGTSGNYMPVNNNYVSDANSVKTTQITKTNNSTSNLPNEITREKLGVIQFVAENDSAGNGTQMYWPIDSAYAGRMYIRGHNKDGWTEWKRYATTSEIPTVPTTLPNPNKLILSGAVTAEYDGSSEVSVEIPAGGSGSYTLPIASATQLGGVQPVAKTDEMTQPVGVDEAGGLWGSPGGAGGEEPLLDITVEEEVGYVQIELDGSEWKEFEILIKLIGTPTNANEGFFYKAHFFKSTNFPPACVWMNLHPFNTADKVSYYHARMVLTASMVYIYDIRSEKSFEDLNKGTSNNASATECVHANLLSNLSSNGRRIPFLTIQGWNMASQAIMGVGSEVKIWGVRV